MKVVLSKDAQKQYSKLPKSEQLKIKKKLTSLQENPLAGKNLAGELSGQRSLRVWPYRIIYSLNQAEQRVEVNSILRLIKV